MQGSFERRCGLLAGLRRAMLVGVLAGTLAACGQTQESQHDGEALQVATHEVEPRHMPLVLETVGRTEGSKEVELRARVSGILEKQVYDEGLAVKAGATLFRIDPVPFEIALAHAQAALAQEQAVNQQARRNADRLTALAAQKAVSRRQADDAISALEASDAAILAAQAKLREAQTNLSYTRVTAPIDGIAGRAEHSEGSLVTANAQSGLLTTITQTDPIWVRFALSLDEFEAMRAAGAGGPAALSVDLLGSDGGARARGGRVNFAGSTVDTTLGTVQLRAEFSNPALSILPGEYLRVRLSGGEMLTITVPQRAVQQGMTSTFVWIVNAQGKAEQRVVQTDVWIGDGWRIRSGLDAGDTLILDNLMKLQAGQAVSGKAEVPQRAAEQYPETDHLPLAPAAAADSSRPASS